MNSLVPEAGQLSTAFVRNLTFFKQIGHHTSFPSYICFMYQKRSRGSFYIIAWTVSAAFFIRAMILRNQVATSATDDLSIWQSPSFYFVLSAIGLILGVYLLKLKGKNSDSE